MSLVLILLLASPALADDLAALARKEKERRAKLAKPTRVFTESDGKNGGGSVTTMSGAASPPVDTQPPAGGSPEAQKATWKAKADAARAEIWTTQNALEVREREFAEFQSDIAAISAADALDPMRLQKREARLGELRAQLEQQRRLLANAQKSLSVLENEARKLGIPPGWLR